MNIAWWHRFSAPTGVPVLAGPAGLFLGGVKPVSIAISRTGLVYVAKFRRRRQRLLPASSAWDFGGRLTGNRG